MCALFFFVRFILTDLVAKVDAILAVDPSKIPSNHAAEASHWRTIISAADLVSDLLQFLPRLVHIFKQLASHLNGIVAAVTVDGADVALKYTPEANYTKACMAHILHILATVYAWPEMQKAAHRALFDKSLATLQLFDPGTTIAGGVESPPDPETSITAAIRAIVAHETAITDLTTAVHMLRLVQALSKFYDNTVSVAAGCQQSSQHYQHAVVLCKQFLSRRWFVADGSAERGARCNALLDELTRGLFVRVKMSSLQQIVGRVLGEAKRLRAKDSVLSMYPMITK